MPVDWTTVNDLNATESRSAENRGHQRRGSDILFYLRKLFQKLLV